MEPITITLPAFHPIPPESTDDVIIFPFSYGSQKFSREDDSTRIIQGKASLDDINDVLTVFELVLSRADSTRKFLMNLLLPLFILYLLTLIGCGMNLSASIKQHFLALIFICIFVGSSLYKRMCQTGRTKVEVQRMLEMIRPVYAKRGLTWHFSEHFFCSWLELRKEGSADEQNSTLRTEIRSSQNRESFIPQKGSCCRIFEDFTDGENIIVCAGKNLTSSDFSPPIQFQYVICFIICAYISKLFLNYQYDTSLDYYYELLS